MLIKTSVVCLIFVLYMLWFYYRKPHIPTKSTRIFRLLTGMAFVNVLFDLITIYTVNHRDWVPEGVNLIAHIIYLLSILGYIYLLFLYLRSYLEAWLTFSKAIKAIQSLPCILSTIGILVLPITYVHGETTDYALGLKVYALYGSIVVYLILILYYSLRYWESLNREKRMAIILAVPIYVSMSLIQMFIPESLLAVCASTLILLGLILSNENAEKYIDENTLLFNQYSFETVLEEFNFEKQKLYIAVICLCKTEYNSDWKQDLLILKDIHREIKQRHLNAYRIGENGVIYIGSTKEKTETALEEVKQAIENKYGAENISIATKLLWGEETENRYKCMQNIVAFCTEIGQRFAYMDYLTHVYNRNAFERDLKTFDKNGNGYYLIADLNNLKVVNDTIGHSAGDELLMSFAGLLNDVVGNDGRAYRQGGDEFAVLYRRDAQEFVRQLEEKCNICNLSRSVPISYAIGYSRFGEKDFVDVADAMMYANKKEMKNAGK